MLIYVQLSLDPHYHLARHKQDCYLRLTYVDICAVITRSSLSSSQTQARLLSWTNLC
uniref:Uncharacterized protein n=1 Tax=Arundo donax TaxID=35708 RepID=A0A0A9AR41_ARUDO